MYTFTPKMVVFYDIIQCNTDKNMVQGLLKCLLFLNRTIYTVGTKFKMWSSVTCHTFMNVPKFKLQSLHTSVTVKNLENNQNL